MAERKLLTNARIFTPLDGGRPARGPEQGRIAVYDPGAMIIADGIIERVGPEAEVTAGLAGGADPGRRRKEGPTDGRSGPDRGCTDMERIDAGGRCVIPGFVDAHTHMCFAGTREDEFALRLGGADYMEIHRRGGGIMSSVRMVRAATDEDLLNGTAKNLERSLAFGVTTVEVKSGYGLSTRDELRQLDAIRRAASHAPQDIVATFLGAHSVPEEYRGRGDEFVDLVVSEMLPAAAEHGGARYCDVFTEEGVFTVEQSERVLGAARELGFGLKAHVDEIVDLGGAAMAARLGCVSAEHLIAAADEGLEAMAKAGTIAVVLPGTSFSLGKPFARARRMVELGVPVVLATDCNPGSCYTESLPFVYTLGTMKVGLTLEEALVAVTLNAAYAIGAEAGAGSLEPGKQADFVVLEGRTPAFIPYHLAVNPVAEVYKRGSRVV